MVSFSLSSSWAILFNFWVTFEFGINLKVIVDEADELRKRGCFFLVLFNTRLVDDVLGVILDGVSVRTSSSIEVFIESSSPSSYICDTGVFWVVERRLTNNGIEELSLIGDEVM